MSMAWRFPVSPFKPSQDSLHGVLTGLELDLKVHRVLLYHCHGTKGRNCNKLLG